MWIWQEPTKMYRRRTYEESHFFKKQTPTNNREKIITETKRRLQLLINNLKELTNVLNIYAEKKKREKLQQKKEITNKFKSELLEKQKHDEEELANYLTKKLKNSGAKQHRHDGSMLISIGYREVVATL